MKAEKYRLIVLLAVWKCSGQSGRAIRQCVETLCPYHWSWLAWVWNWTVNCNGIFYLTLRSLESDGLVSYVPIPGRDGVWHILHKGACMAALMLPESDLHCDIFDFDAVDDFDVVDASELLDEPDEQTG